MPPGWTWTIWGDKAIIDILRRTGAKVKCKGTEITVSRGRLESYDVDMSDIPDLFPVTPVPLVIVEGNSRLYGVPQLKFKESNRIETIVNMINDIGGNAEVTDDGCMIYGKPRLTGEPIVRKATTKS